jgi:drug/metabolite transporter (DMT)-like permease
VQEEKRARMLLLCVVMFWGLNVVMVKYLAEHFAPLMLAALRMAAAAMLLTVFMVRQHGWCRVSLKEWGWLTGIAVSGIFLHQITLSAGVQTTEASTTSLILGLNPLVTMVLAYAIFREPLTVRKLIGVALGFAGVTLVVFGRSIGDAAIGAFGMGELWILVAMLTYAISGMFIKKATETQPVMVVTAYSHLLATALLGMAATVDAGAGETAVVWPDDWFVWAVLLFSAWVATGLGSLWWNRGIRVIGAGRTAMYINGMPGCSLVFSVLLLGETISWLHGVGFLMVFVAIYIGTSTRKVTPSPAGMGSGA